MLQRYSKFFAFFEIGAKKLIKYHVEHCSGIVRTMATEGIRVLNAPLEESDPELYNLIREEKKRQITGLEMIASENFTTLPVLQCLSSCLNNKYSEGLPGQRYYGGNEFIDKIELLAQQRCLEAYNLDESEWGCNVQPYSGSPANFAVYTALIGPHGRLMGLDLPDGGHLTHGFFSGSKKVSATSLFFESMPYRVDAETGLIDYDKLQSNALLFRPNLIVAGISCYARALDYARFQDICDSVGAYLMADMSHISGLVAAGVTPAPFPHCDIVTTTTHKSLRGPRAAVIFYRKSLRDVESKINQAVFPGLQGGPHNNAIAAIATAMRQTRTPQFRQYAAQVVTNAKYLAQKLQERGYNVVTGGTDIHLVHVDLRKAGVSGAKAEYALECVGIACNKNTVPGDKSALNASGIRLGTPALTTRGFVKSDFDFVVDLIDRTIKLAKQTAAKSASAKLVDFKKTCQSDIQCQQEMTQLRTEVMNFSQKFPLPGYEQY